MEEREGLKWAGIREVRGFSLSAAGAKYRALQAFLELKRFFLSCLFAALACDFFL